VLSQGERRYAYAAVNFDTYLIS